MRRFTLIGDDVMDLVQIGSESEAELFEEFFREIHPESGLASHEIENYEMLNRTAAEEERVQDLMLQFGIWRTSR